MVFDLAFFSAFIYVANANRGGAGSCTGRVDTPFGSGEADSYAKDGLPNFQAACRLETACFALAMIAMYVFPDPERLQPELLLTHPQFLLSLLPRNRALPRPPSPKGAPPCSRGAK